jgi:hypothetical protein
MLRGGPSYQHISAIFRTEDRKQNHIGFGAAFEGFAEGSERALTRFCAPVASSSTQVRPRVTLRGVSASGVMWIRIRGKLPTSTIEETVPKLWVSAKVGTPSAPKGENRGSPQSI